MDFLYKRGVKIPNYKVFLMYNQYHNHIWGNMYVSSLLLSYKCSESMYTCYRLEYFDHHIILFMHQCDKSVKHALYIIKSFTGGWISTLDIFYFTFLQSKVFPTMIVQLTVNLGLSVQSFQQLSKSYILWCKSGNAFINN